MTRQLTDASPSDMLAQVLTITPRERMIDASGRPLVIPSQVFDVYGAPHRMVAAVGHTLTLLLERVTPLDAGAVAQKAIMQCLADGCKELAAKIDKKAEQFAAQFPD